MLEAACMFSPGPFEKMEIAPWTFSPVVTTPVILGDWVAQLLKFILIQSFSDLTVHHQGLLGSPDCSSALMFRGSYLVSLVKEPALGGMFACFCKQSSEFMCRTGDLCKSSSFCNDFKRLYKSGLMNSEHSCTWHSCSVQPQTAARLTPGVHFPLSITPLQKLANATVITIEKFTERLTPKMCFSFCSCANFLFTLINSDWFTFLAEFCFQVNMHCECQGSKVFPRTLALFVV